MTLLFSLALASAVLGAPPVAQVPLAVVAVGAGGGLDEGDLSAWLVSAPAGGWVLLDAGSTLGGLKVAFEKGAFPELDRKLKPDTAAGKILREHTKAVLLSHAHLDHTLGLIVATPDDAPRKVYGLASTLDALRDHALNWKLWPNLGSEGAPPALKKLTYQRLDAGKPSDLPGTGYRVTAFPLAHAGMVSTAFLLESDAGSVLYLGDTGPDSVEKTDKLKLLWERVAPLARDKKLRAIFLEASFPSDRADDKLFGHLTPRHLSAELIRLATIVNPQDPGQALAGLTVIVTHIKPSLDGDDVRGRIATELSQMNTLGVRFVLPKQGDRLAL
jgi:3',5'-cyclic-nucleotide phosphodiesterase